MENIDVYIEKVMKKRFKDVLDDYQKGKIRKEAEALREQDRRDEKMRLLAQAQGTPLFWQKCKIFWFRLAAYKNYYRSIDGASLRKKSIDEDDNWRCEKMFYIAISFFYLIAIIMAVGNYPLPMPKSPYMNIFDLITFFFCLPASFSLLLHLLDRKEKAFLRIALAGILFYTGWIVWAGQVYSELSWPMYLILIPFLSVLFGLLIAILIAQLCGSLHNYLKPLTD